MPGRVLVIVDASNATEYLAQCRAYSLAVKENPTVVPDIELPIPRDPGRAESGGSCGVIISDISFIDEPVRLRSSTSAGKHYLRLGSGIEIEVTADGSYWVESEYGVLAKITIALADWEDVDYYVLRAVAGSMEIPIVGLGDSPLSSLIFEDIARKVYDDPMLGVLLRQINIVDKAQGEQYIIPDLKELSKEKIIPDSDIFRDPSVFSNVYKETL